MEAPSPSPPPSGSPTYGFVHHEEDEEEGEVGPSTAEKLDLAEVRELLKLLRCAGQGPQGHADSQATHGHV